MGTRVKANSIIITIMLGPIVARADIVHFLVLASSIS